MQTASDAIGRPLALFCWQELAGYRGDT